ncbi:hypothetical protein F4778DRAFT_716048 [Xylariomycetidae sp. FL2044]|nr:hypothetical protein F4778DRAFT_716048 [Xylariomycetidae sp. FL2044]
MVYSSVGDAVPQLADLIPTFPSLFPIYLGGQNFTHCCLVALNESLAIQDGNLSYTATNFVQPGVSIVDLEYSMQTDEFPCGSSFNGDTRGTPEVRVPYGWCTEQCPGWEISHFGVMQQWIGPLVQFIVPSLAFCTNIPRTKKLGIPDRVFGANPRTILGFGSYWVRLLGALILMTIDTFVWLAICFAFAGPMLMSAVYEYALDRKVLEFLSPPHGDHPEMPMRLRAQLLLAVVVGNIRMATLERADIVGVSIGRQDSGMTDDESKVPVPTHRIVHNSILKRVMVMVDEYEASRIAGKSAEEEGVSLPTKLKALLNSQASFGSTVGAPILFFVGGFIYTVLDIDHNLGDNDTAHALGFGMWWMVIPYLAIISCAMLAANSPSTLEGIVYDGHKSALPDRYELGCLAEHIERAKCHETHLGRLIRLVEVFNPVETAYEGRFRTVKLWKRGLNKRQWVQEAIIEYEATVPAHIRQGYRLSPEKLRKRLTLNPKDSSGIVSGALCLLLIPCILAFLTSYNTPRAGLSCRSLTYLVYAISQVCEMALWALAARLRIVYGARWYETSPIAKRLCWWGQLFVGFFAIFAAVGGTLMQLMGVYRSCLCEAPAAYWPNLGDPDAYILLSNTTAEDILAAQQWWTATGSAAVIMVGIVCALAWWHQRRLRKTFRDEADKLELDAVGCRQPYQTAGGVRT